MAWNEPGGNGSKDPWGSRKNNEQGPPDIDEMMRKLQQKFRSLFGGGGGRRTESSDGRSGGPGIKIIVAIALVVWVLSGIYIIDPAERGVVLRLGNYVATTGPGPHWHIPYPIETVDEVNVDEIRNVEIGFRSGGLQQTAESIGPKALMLTKDENIIDINLAVQYRVKDARDYLFKVIDPETTLIQATESAVREIVGKNTMDFALTEGRTEIAARIEELTQSILDNYVIGLQITSVNIQNAQPPEEVQDAFRDVVRAREDEQRSINEAQAYANDIIPRARGASARLLEEAQAYKGKTVAQSQGEASRFMQVLDEYQKAPEVTRKRLYLEAMESVLSNTSKVMVDVEGGNNLLYLPLDRLMQQRDVQGVPAQAAVPLSPEISGSSTSVAERNDLRERNRNRGEQ